MYRKATLDDREEIYSLICDMECKELLFQKFCQIFQRQINDRNYYCIVKEHEDHVAAVLNLRFEEQLHHADRIAEIMEFVVHPDLRNRGIGGDMLDHACEVARENGCIQIEVACNQLRKDTHRFYLREGMKNFHYKFSKSLAEDNTEENMLGR